MFSLTLSVSVHLHLCLPPPAAPSAPIAILLCIKPWRPSVRGSVAAIFILPSVLTAKHCVQIPGSYSMNMG